MASREKNGEAGRENFFLYLIRTSIIINALDRFTVYIYDLIKNGFFGYIFTGYHFSGDSWFGERIKKSKFSSHVSELRYGICRRIETSVIIYYVSWIMRYLRSCKIRVYGVFFLSFGSYTAIVSIVNAILRDSLGVLLETENMTIALVLIVSSIPLIMSRKNLSESLTSSVVGRVILKFTGFDESDLIENAGDGGHCNTAFILGIIFGACTYAVSPVLILGGAAAVVWAYLVLLKPEIGVLTMFFMMPVLPTMVLAAIVVFTALSWGIKLLRGKRLFSIEPIDIAALAFMVLVAAGGFVSLSDASLKPALLMTCLAFGYILAVELLTDREWLVRCSIAYVITATLIALYGIILLYTGGGYTSDAWTDSSMFSDWTGRAVSTLDNPNMLGEYLIMVIPIAFSMLIGRGEGVRRFSALVSLGILGVCLILTSSRGAWLGILIAMFAMVMIWHRRALFTIFAAVAAAPFLQYILPASITSRFSSIGNMTDSSTSYRVYSWRAAVEMIADHFWTGIGVGEGAWDRVYPIYAYQGVEASPHSHNLFLEIWLYLGVFGLLVFAVFLFLLYKSGFSLYANLSRDVVLKNPDLSEDLMLKNTSVAEKLDAKQEIKRTKFQLRISSAGVLCGILAALMQGMTDYTWYNYRVYLMFWLTCGLASAYIRTGSKMIKSDGEVGEAENTSCDMVIPLNENNDKNNINSRKNKKSTESMK